MRFKISFILLFIIISFKIFTAEHALRCDKALSPILAKIETLPEGKELVSGILEQGPLKIRVSRFSTQFEGSWTAYDRVIHVTKRSNMPESSLITTLLFELQNAYRTADLESIYRMATSRQLSKKEFIRKVEYFEYENALATSKLLKLGIAAGIFPRSSYWYISGDFEKHFAAQKRGGHSAAIGKIYNQIVG